MTKLIKVIALMDNVGAQGVKVGDTVEVSEKQLPLLIKEGIVEKITQKEAPKQEAPKKDTKKKEEGEK